MYRQSSRVVGRGGVGPLRVGGAFLCLGRSVTLHSHRSVGILQVRWVHLARPYIALPRSWLQLRRAACPGTCAPTCPRCGGCQVRPPRRKMSLISAL